MAGEIVVTTGTCALAAPPTAEQIFISTDSTMLSIRTVFEPSPGMPEASVRIEHPRSARRARRDRATTTEALIDALGKEDLTALIAAGAQIEGDREVVRRLLAGVRVPGG